jgi:hypothetical protein
MEAESITQAQQQGFICPLRVHPFEVGLLSRCV